MYSFESKIASRGYHVYRNSTWQNAKANQRVKVEIETNKSSRSIDPYACAIKIKHQYFETWLTVGHIPREISRHCYFFLKEEGNIEGHLISTDFKVSPIPAGGLEVPLLLKFSVKRERIFHLMKQFVSDLYDYNYCGEQKGSEEEESDDSDDNEEIQIEMIDDNSSDDNEKESEDEEKNIDEEEETQTNATKDDISKDIIEID